MKGDFLAYLDDILRSGRAIKALSPDAHSRTTPLTNCFEAGWNGNSRLSESPSIGSNATSQNSCSKSPSTVTSSP